MSELRVVNEIRNQIYAFGTAKVWSWGAHAWKAINRETLQFKVRGHHFKGQVRVELDVVKDLYKVHFGHYSTAYPGRWKNIETIEDVYFDSLTDLIDERVEYIKAYGGN